jgi:pimeloyl-ACP methyl ester carboxylesterase
MSFQLLLKILLYLFGGFMVLGMALYLTQDHLLFHPRPLQTQIQQWIAQTYPHAQLTITAADGTQLQGWLIKKPVAQEKLPLIIYFGGNAEEVSGMAYHAQRFNGWAVLLINYRGYGLSEGKPNEKNLFSDAITIFDAMTREPFIDMQNIIVMGRSLGTGVAVYLAAHRPVAGVILVTPFDSITHVAQRHLPWFPVSLLLKHPFNSLALAPSITKPMLALVGQQDTLISPRHAYRLVEKWAGEYEIRLIPNANHNNISDTEVYWEAIGQFLESRIKLD